MLLILRHCGRRLPFILSRVPSRSREDRLTTTISRLLRRDYLSIRARSIVLAGPHYNRLEEEYAEGTFDPWLPGTRSDSLTVTKVKKRFLKSREHLRPKTRKAYRVALKYWDTPPGMMIADVAAEHVRPYVCDPRHTVPKKSKKKVTVASLRKRYRHLRTFFNWLVKRGMLDSSLLDDVEPPKAEESVPDFLTPEQLKRSLRAIDADLDLAENRSGVMPEVQGLKDIILIAVCTGMRRGELVNLRWNDVDLESGFITVRNSEDFRAKSEKERRIPLVGQARDVVKRLYSARDSDANQRVLRKEDGSPVNAGYATEQFKHYAELAKLPGYIKFHSLRATCASWLVQDGVPLAVVQKILGHSSRSVTEKYLHLTPDVRQRAMEGTFGSS